MDFLFIALRLEVRQQGFTEFTQGMAPLSGLAPARSRRLWDRFGGLIRRHGGQPDNFAGVRALKCKFDPQWRRRYLATSSAYLPTGPLADAARLSARKRAS